MGEQEALPAVAVLLPQQRELVLLVDALGEGFVPLQGACLAAI
jgi:hypothetical protein